MFWGRSKRSARGRRKGLLATKTFERHIRPVLVEHCYQCHSAKSQPLKGGLALDSAAGLQAGGDSGEVVSAGQPEDSLLLSALRHDALEMPPKKRLPQVTIDRFAHWIEQGAYYPGAGAPPADSVASRAAEPSSVGRRLTKCTVGIGSTDIP